MFEQLHSHSSIVIVEYTTVVFCLFVVRELGFTLSLLRSRFLCLVLSNVSEVLTHLFSEEESRVLLTVVLIAWASAIFHELLRDCRWEECRFIRLQWVGPWSLSYHHWCPRLRHSGDRVACLPSRTSATWLVRVRIEGFVYQLASFLSHEAAQYLVITLCSRYRKRISCDHQHFQIW